MEVSFGLAGRRLLAAAGCRLADLLLQAQLGQHGLQPGFDIGAEALHAGFAVFTDVRQALQHIALGLPGHGFGLPARGLQLAQGIVGRTDRLATGHCDQAKAGEPDMAQGGFRGLAASLLGSHSGHPHTGPGGRLP